jgi:SecD/SecF fusion protein
MQNKGTIRLFAIALALVCIYQLSFTIFTKYYESKAKNYSKGDPKKEAVYLDSISNEVVFNLAWLKKYTFKDCKEREVSLGLDLKGGMNVVLEVSVKDLIRSMSDYSTDSTFNKALVLAQKMQETRREDFVTLFGIAFEKLDPNGKLAAIFSTRSLKDKIPFNASNSQVLSVINKEAQNAIDNSFNILRSRIDKFGVVQPNIQKLQNSGRILVELPGVKEPERVRKLLQGTANLQFWETYENSEIYKYLLEANNKIKELKESSKKDTSLAKNASDTSKTAKAEVSAKTEPSLLSKLSKSDSLKKDSAKVSSTGAMKDYPLFEVLHPYTYNQKELLPGSIVGLSFAKDTSKVNTYLQMKSIKGIFPKDVKFLWSDKAHKTGDKTKELFELHAIKVTSRDGQPALSGDVVTDARPEYGQNKAEAMVTMSMNSEGAKTWAKITKQNIGRNVAVVLDNYVRSSATVQGEIKGGNTQITGNYTYVEAQDLANILKSGKMPAPAKIISEEVVGPTLGKEAINKGFISFLIAFICVLLYMSLYYGTAGHVADIALFANVFFLMGVLASFGAVLTLPGIAGIVLTLAMAVDGNVIIYERMREEMRAGKGIRLVVKDGFHHAYSAIIDGHVTTILTGVVLYIFGSGSIQGFATTLIIGLLLSLFSSIFIARLVFEWMLDRNMAITVDNKYTKNAFQNIHIPFIEIRKTMYVLSGILIGIGIVSLFVRGLDPGIDFTGGRSYIVRFDQPVKTEVLGNALMKQFGDAPEVKTFGPTTQVKITTKYLIHDKSDKTDSIIETKLYNGLKGFYRSPLSYAEFADHAKDKPIGRMSSTRVDPVMSNEMIYKAFMAVFFGLICIFIYIAIRFKNWKFGLGGVVSLFHDSMVVITMFTLFYGILPFNLEVDQSFIAALLTVIGYSIMDTVIIFDRIREYGILYPKRDLATNIDNAINSTLGRTINTSGVTLVVLIIIFIFGGEVLRGFIFALLVGVTIGTYSSVFNATPVAYDLIMLTSKKKKEVKEVEK